MDNRVVERYIVCVHAEKIQRYRKLSAYISLRG